MKWYITESDPVIPEVNTVRIVQRELGSEAAGIAVKWPYRPVVTRSVMVEQPVWVDSLDSEGNPVLDEFGEPVLVQEGTELVETQQAVDYPYIVLDGEDLRAATDEERAAIDAVLVEREASTAADAKAATRTRIRLAITNENGTPRLGIFGLAAACRTALRAIFGPDAETNRNITKEVVAMTLLQLPPEQYDAKTADMLKMAFEELSAVTGDGTTWTFYEAVGDLIPESWS